MTLDRRGVLAAGAAFATLGPTASLKALAANTDPVRIGLILPMTGAFSSTGRQVEAAVKLFQKQNGMMAGGRRVEMILRDDAGVADNTRRHAQELITQQKVAALAGFGLTPCTMAVGPLATQSKTPMVVMAAASAVILSASPFVVRSSYSVPASCVVIA